MGRPRDAVLGRMDKGTLGSVPGRRSETRWVIFLGSPASLLILSDRDFDFWNGREDGTRTEQFSGVYEGTGDTTGRHGYGVPAPDSVTWLGLCGRAHLQKNACSTYNLLAEEGRRVAAALLPIVPKKWTE